MLARVSYFYVWPMPLFCGFLAIGNFSCVGRCTLIMIRGRRMRALSSGALARFAFLWAVGNYNYLSYLSWSFNDGGYENNGEMNAMGINLI